MRTLLTLLTALALGSALPGEAAPAAAGRGLRIEQPYARPTVDGQPGGAYLTIENAGPPDRLVGIGSRIATDTELHEMRMDGDVMRMRRIEAIDLPTGARVRLAPGGLHVMLLGLDAPLRAGRQFELTLQFEKAGRRVVSVPVQAPGAAGSASAPRRHR